MYFVLRLRGNTEIEWDVIFFEKIIKTADPYVPNKDICGFEYCAYSSYVFHT